MDFPRSDRADHVCISSCGEQAIGSEVVASQPGTFAGAAWPVANKALFIPFRVQAPFLAQVMATVPNSNTVGNLDLGIYDEVGNRLVSKGSTAQANANLVQSLDIADTLLLPGLYYMAMAVDSASAWYYRLTLTSAQVCAAIGMLEMASAFPLPATAAFATIAATYVPLFTVAGRSFV